MSVCCVAYIPHESTADVFLCVILLRYQEEVVLYTDSRDRKRWDQLSEFFAIIITTEHLENARIKSAIGRDEVILVTLAYCIGDVEVHVL